MNASVVTRSDEIFPGRDPEHSIAVLIPCLNEEIAIAKVVTDFRAALPDADVYVYDNGSTDRTMQRAREAGAIVRVEPMRGKGNVVRRMFADVDAAVYVLVDGDDTYEAGKALALVRLLMSNCLDMVNGTRRSVAQAAYRPGHRLGNRVLTQLVSAFFGRPVRDMLTGYRVFSRRFVKSFPALAAGFEIETELLVHALKLRMPMADIETIYRERPSGSASKLSTYKDGLRILRTILYLLREEKPLAFFSTIALGLGVLALILGIPVIVEFHQTHLVTHLPKAVLAATIGSMSFLSFTCGLILDTVSLGRLEAKRLAYLALSARPGPVQSSRAR
jgi:glycosyltransferase involved in cell wall biosynthesis